MNQVGTLVNNNASIINCDECTILAHGVNNRGDSCVAVVAAGVGIP